LRCFKALRANSFSSKAQSRILWPRGMGKFGMQGAILLIQLIATCRCAFRQLKDSRTMRSKIVSKFLWARIIELIRKNAASAYWTFSLNLLSHSREKPRLYAKTLVPDFIARMLSKSWFITVNFVGCLAEFIRRDVVSHNPTAFRRSSLVNNRKAFFPPG